MAKKKTLEKTTDSEINAKVSANRVAGDHMVTFVSNGKFKMMGLNSYELTADKAQALVDKGFGEIK